MTFNVQHNHPRTTAVPSCNRRSNTALFCPFLSTSFYLYTYIYPPSIHPHVCLFPLLLPSSPKILLCTNLTYTHTENSKTETHSNISSQHQKRQKQKQEQKSLLASVVVGINILLSLLSLVSPPSSSTLFVIIFSFHVPPPSFYPSAFPLLLSPLVVSIDFRK